MVLLFIDAACCAKDIWNDNQHKSPVNSKFFIIFCSRHMTTGENKNQAKVFHFFLHLVIERSKKVIALLLLQLYIESFLEHR